MAEKVVAGSQRLSNKTNGVESRQSRSNCSKSCITSFTYVRSFKAKIDLEYCPTKMMVADILTKPFPCEIFETLRKDMGLESPKYCPVN